MRALALLALLALTGCVTAPVHVACPPLKSYTAAQQTAMAAELATLPDGDPIGQAIVDYGQLRGEVRACQGAPP